MTNILNKIPAELIALAPDLDNAEIDALVEQWCMGHEIRHNKRWGWQTVDELGAIKVCNYTTDWRVAGRLMVKYQIAIYWANEKHGDVWSDLAFNMRRCFIGDPLRDIAEVALLVALTEAMEKE